jgi:hypothetical protein
MGKNATVVVAVDYLDDIKRDPAFGKILAEAIQTLEVCRLDRVDVVAGNVQNAAHVVEVHHSNNTAVVTVGGGLGVKQLEVPGWRQSPELSERMLREWADKLGFDLAKKPAAEAMRKMYLLVLTGGGDTYVRLVTEDVWTWIHQSFDMEQREYHEEVPASVRAEAKRLGSSSFKDGKQYVTRGSYQNDRALAAPGLEFDDVAQVTKYAAPNKVSIEGTFNGCVY